jgi:hypothetical protein
LQWLLLAKSVQFVACQQIEFPLIDSHPVPWLSASALHELSPKTQNKEEKILQHPIILSLSFF